MKDFDVYFAHAWEDKPTIEPLVDQLRSQGLRVWYDDDQLSTGMSLRQQLDAGMKCSEYGVVVLSKAFFTPSKRWAPMEFDVWLEAAPDAQSRILIVWLDVTKSEVQQWSPIAGTLFAFRSDDPTLAVRLADDVQDRLIRDGRFGAYLRSNIERNMEWVRPPQVIHGALRELDVDTSWEGLTRLDPSPDSVAPPLRDVFENAERFFGQPLLLTGEQVFQQALRGAPRWQEFSVQRVTGASGYERCLLLVLAAKVAPYRLPVPKAPVGHLPMIDCRIVALGGLDFGGGETWQTVVVLARNISYLQMPDVGTDRELSSVHWPTEMRITS